MTKQERNELVARMAKLEQRLEKGWHMQGDDVDDLFERVLERYQVIYDRLREAGHV